MYTCAVNFLKMVAMGDEVQIRRDPTRGNLYWDVFLIGNYIVGIPYLKKMFNIFNNDIRNLERYVWIPTMLQLQIICCAEAQVQGQYAPEKFQRFLSDSALITARLFENHSKLKNNVFTSEQEAYLAMMYLTLYNKAWDGEDWVKIKKPKKKRKKKK